jgi:protein O-mannosyl-transferase
MTPQATRSVSGKHPQKTLVRAQVRSRTPFWQNQWLICALLVAATLALYSPIGGYGFVDYDDGFYVTENSHVRAGLTWATVGWAFRSTEASNWHPLTWLSHIVDYEFYGSNAGGHHITSLLIHVLNVLLLFLLLLRVTGYLGRSFMVAALFALHPFNVESVVWIAERKNVLSTLFLLLTLAAYGRYARHPDWKRYTLALLLFSFGLASKPMLVTLPFLLLLVDYCPLQRVAGWSEVSESFPMTQFSVRHLVVEKIPFFLLSAASSVITVIAQKRGGAINSMDLLPLRARLENAVLAYGRYIWKTLWPAGFAVHYPNPFDPMLSSRPTWWTWCAVAASALMLVAVSALVWRQRRARPYLLVGWLWYLGTLVPVIGLVQVGMQGMADRYAYVPVIGIFVMLVWGVGSLSNYAALSNAWRWGTSAAILLLLIFLSSQQIERWESNYSLWWHAAEVTRDNFLADDHLGLILQQEGNAGALVYFEAAARIAPWDPVSRCALAMNLEDQGLHQDALREFETVIHRPMTPELLALAKANVGMIYGELGDYAKSHENLQEAQQADSSVIENLIQGFSQSLASRPADETYLRLGILLEQAGRKDQARLAVEKVLQKNPGAQDAQALLNHLNEGGK